MPCLYFYFTTQESTVVESQATVGVTTAVVSTVSTVTSGAGPLHAANVTIKASAKINLFIVFLFLRYVIFFMVFVVHQPSYKYLKQTKKP